MSEPLWECPGCGLRIRCDPVGGDDWDGEEVAVGPDCDDCEEEMDLVNEIKATTAAEGE